MLHLSANTQHKELLSTNLLNNNILPTVVKVNGTTA